MFQTTKKAKGFVPLVLAILAFFFAGIGSASAQSPVLTQPAKYVIQNVETGQFMQYNPNKSATKAYVVFSSTIDNSVNAVWNLTKNGDGYLISCDGKKLSAYLKSNLDIGYYKNCYDTKRNATTFYIYKNPFSEYSYAVSTDNQNTATIDNHNKNCWYIYYAKDGAYGFESREYRYWLCSTEDTPLNQKTTNGGSNYAHLSNFRFFTYADLYNKAKRLGYGNGTNTDENLAIGDSTSNANYATLVNWLVSKESSNAATTFTSSLLDTTSCVLLVNRRYGTYLAMDTKGAYYSANAITSDCLWVPFHSDDHQHYKFLHYGNANPLIVNGTALLTLQPSADADTVAVGGKDKNGNARLDSLGYFRIGDGVTTPTWMTIDWVGTTTRHGLKKETTYSYKIIERQGDESASQPFVGEDWSFVPYDFNDKIESTATRETSIKDSLFFRLQNEGYSLANKGSGWLVDVDRTDMRNFDPFLSNKTGTADATSKGGYDSDDDYVDVASVRKTQLSSTGSRGKATAASLWHLIRVAKANSNEPAIGITGTHDHDIYRIKNANSGKYLGYTLNNNNTTNNFIHLVDKKDDAALFWLEDIGRGQYAIAMRDPSEHDYDKLKGYLQILAPSDPSNNQEIEYYRAGLQLGSINKPAAGGVGAWSILQATSVHAKTATSTAEEDKALSNKLFPKVTDDEGLRYVTAYYPFDVIPTSPYAKAFRAEWADPQHTTVRFVECKGIIPAYKGALVVVPNENKHANIEYNVFAATAKNSEYDNDILTGIVESEQMDFKQLGANKVDTAALRQSIYILTTEIENGGNPGYQTVPLGLYHPDDEYLMENRCFIRLAGAGASLAKELNVTFEVNEPTGITELPAIPSRHYDDAWYDLTGRRVMHPTRGLYIHNGRKVAIE